MGGGCSQICIKRGRGRVCRCRRGFKLLADRRSCQKTCQKSCPRNLKRVCASNGRTYGNKCLFEIAQCQAKKKGIKLIIISQGRCKAPKHPCNIKNGGCNQICRKSGRNAICRCRRGYRLMADKKTCKKLPHPCDKNKGGCSHICRKIGNRAFCRCPRGYRLLGNRKSCRKIFKHPCDKRNRGGCSQICQKRGRGRVCRCRRGFKLLANKRSCRRIHLCDRNRGGCSQICINRGRGR